MIKEKEPKVQIEAYVESQYGERGEPDRDRGPDGREAGAFQEDPGLCDPDMSGAYLLSFQQDCCSASDGMQSSLSIREHVSAEGTWVARPPPKRICSCPFVASGLILRRKTAQSLRDRMFHGLCHANRASMSATCGGGREGRGRDGREEGRKGELNIVPVPVSHTGQPLLRDKSRHHIVQLQRPS